MLKLARAVCIPGFGVTLVETRKGYFSFKKWDLSQKVGLELLRCLPFMLPWFVVVPSDVRVTLATLRRYG